MSTFKSRIEGLIGVDDEIDQDDYDSIVRNGCQEIINLVPKDMLWALGQESLISKGSIRLVEVINTGESYTSTVTPVWNEPDIENGVKPIATFELEDDDNENNTFRITGIIITHPGSGYKNTLPTLTTDEEGLPGVTDAEFVVHRANEYSEISTNTILQVIRETESYTNLSSDSVDGEYDRTSLIECREIPSALKGRVRPGSGWSEEVTENDPIYYKENGKVYILPEPYMGGSSIITAEVPKTLEALTLAGALVPPEIEYLIDLYSSTMLLNIQITNIQPPKFSDSQWLSETYETMLNGPDFEGINTNFAVSMGDYPGMQNNTIVHSTADYVDFAGDSEEIDEITYDGPENGIDLSDEFTALDGYITDEDPDLAAIQSQKIQAILSEYQAKQNDAVQTMNAQVQGAQNRLQEAIQEVSIKQSAFEKEKSLQLTLIKGKLERRAAAINEVLQLHGSQVTKVQTALQEFQAELNFYDLQKKQKQELQVSLMNSYNAGIQALLSRYKGESREIANPMIQQQQPQGAM